MDKPLILLSNDDGHFSRGLQAIRTALLAFADVVVVAPETEQSAASHALSLHRPLRLRRVEEAIFAVDGTPADCVYVALYSGVRALPRKPDLVVSGINLGLNLGQDVFYSGTVAAAREAALRGIPALATSAHTKADFAAAAEVCAGIAKRLLDTKKPISPTPLLNVNFPREWKDSAVRITRLGARIYEEVLDFRKDPRGREYLWLGGPLVRHDPDPGSDTDAYDAGVISVTPLILDLSADETLRTSVSTLLADRI